MKSVIRFAAEEEKISRSSRIAPRPFTGRGFPGQPGRLPSVWIVAIVSIVLVISIVAVISIVLVISIVPATPNRELGSATIPNPNTIPVIAPIPVTSAVRELSDESYTAICIDPTKSPLAIITLTSYNSLRLGWDARSENRAYTNRKSSSDR